MRLKTRNFILFPGDKLPDIIDDPVELINKIIRKVTINAQDTNLNSTFPWINLAEQTLERYSGFDEKLIVGLKYNLAAVLNVKQDYNRAKELLDDSIKTLSGQSKINKKKLSICYFYMAMTLRGLHDYENARIHILYAMEHYKNRCGFHCEYAIILFKLNNIKEAEDNFKKALTISTTTKGKTHPSTAIIMFNYGGFLASIGETNKARKNMNNAYLSFRNSNGENHLYSARMSGHISNFLYMEKKYAEGLENMKIAYSKTKKILGDDNMETMIYKNNCARLLIKLKKYSDAVEYLDKPIIITDQKEKMILLAYNETIMTAPEMYILKKGNSVFKILKIMEGKNIPIVKNNILKKDIMNYRNQFKPISKEYWEFTATILVKEYKLSAFL